MSLRRQIWVVLLSYLTRTGIRWAMACIALGFALILFAEYANLFHFRRADENPLYFIGVMMIWPSVITAIIIVSAHARQQLMGPATRFMPNTRTANLIVAYAMLFVVTFTLCSPALGDADTSFPSLFMIVLSLTTVIAWAISNPWLIPVAVTWIVLPARSTYAEFCIGLIFHKDVQCEPVPLNGILFENWNEVRHIQLVLRILLLLANIAGLIVLERLSRPKQPGALSRRLWSKLSDALEGKSRTTPERRHPFIQTRLARSLHRRFAVHDWRAAAFLGATIAVLSAVIFHTAGTAADALISIVTMLAVLPGALAAFGWRDRWGSYEFETLYPARHQQFVAEMLIVLLIDMIEYWFASFAAMLLVILAMRSQMLGEAKLWTAISGAAMMQPLWIGGIVLAGRWRQTLPFAAGLGVAVVAMLLTFDNLRRADALLSPSHFIAFATIEMLAGLLLFAIATFGWRRRAIA